MSIPLANLLATVSCGYFLYDILRPGRENSSYADEESYYEKRHKGRTRENPA